MGAEDQISVELIAKIDGLTAGLAQATAQVREAAAGMTSAFKGSGAAAKEHESILKMALSGALFLEFQEIATEALHAVEEAFEATVGKAEEFGLSNAKFAATMGTSEGEAAGLSAALRGVGSSAEEYEGIAVRLEMKVRANEKAMNDLGVVTRDSSGHVLAGKDLMDSAISTLDTYAAGNDRNTVSMELFGKRAEAVYDIRRADAEAVERQTAMYAEFGVKVDGNKQAAQALEEAQNDVRTAFDAVEISLGQKLMPTMTAVIGWISTDGAPILKGLEVTLKALVSAASVVGLAFESLGDVVAGAGMQVWDVSKGIGHVVTDILSGNWKSLAVDAQAAFDEMGKDFHKTTNLMANDVQNVVDLNKDLWGAAERKGETVRSDTGTRKAAPKAGKGGPDKVEEEKLQAAEKLGLAHVQIEEGFNAHLLAMGEETVAEFIAQENALEDKKYKIKLEALTKESNVHGLSKAQHQKLLDEIELLEVTHNAALIKIAEDARTKKAELARQTLATALQSDDQLLAAGMSRIEAEAKLGVISQGEKFQAEIDLTAEVRRQELSRHDAEMATLKAGTKAYDDAYKERQKVAAKFAQDAAKLSEAQAAKVQADVQKWTAPMTRGFASAFNDMLLHGKSFTDGMKELGQSMLEGFISICEQELEHWVVLQITKGLVAQSANAPTLAADRTAIAGSAAEAAAVAYAPLAALPPAAAAAAGAAYGSVISMESLVPAAAGGMVLDKDQLVFAHQKEMILPAHLSQGLAGIIAGGGAGGGGDANLTYAPTINSNQRGLGELLRSEGAAMHAWLREQARSGALRGLGA